jgi:hypothetical protein
VDRPHRRRADAADPDRTQVGLPVRWPADLQILNRQATPRAIAGNELIYDALSSAYKQLNAPFGEFARMRWASRRRRATEPNAEYEAWDAQLTACQNLRQPLATEIDELLNGASFAGNFNVLNASSDLLQAESLLRDIEQLKGSATSPSRTICSASPLLGLLGSLLQNPPL